MDEIVNELNDLYKSMKVDVHFRKSGGNLTMTLKRENPSKPWVMPYFEGELSERIGLPDIKSPEIQPILTQLANSTSSEISITLKTNSVVRDQRRNIGLYVDFLNPIYGGLQVGELIRLPGRFTGRFFDTNMINFHEPIPIPLRNWEIKLVRVQFKDENNHVVHFPIGQNMVILEFNKRNKDKLN